jgi:hypothetical protein
VISYFVIWTSLSTLSYCNASHRTQNKYRSNYWHNKEHTTLFTVTETLEIIRKPGNATSQSVIMAAYKIGLLTVCGIKKHE